MPEHEIVGEIKRLLAEGLNQKALMAGSDYAIEPLRRAVVLSKQTENVIWANVPKYRLAHLLFRYAKTTKQLEEISDHIVTPKLDKKNKLYEDTFNSYVIRSKKRNALKKYLLKNKIEVFSHIDKGVHLEKNLYSKKISLPNTEKLEKEILSLPIYPELSKKNQLTICNAIKKFYIE